MSLGSIKTEVTVTHWESTRTSERVWTRADSTIRNGYYVGSNRYVSYTYDYPNAHVFLITDSNIGMAVLVDIEIDAEAFDLGRITVGDDVHISLDRIVPLTAEVMPFFWAEGTDFEAFEQRVREVPLVDSLEPITRLDGQVLYRVQWSEDAHDFTALLVESGATVLEASGNSRWQFCLRFDTHGGLRALRDRCREAGIDYRIRNISVQTGATEAETGVRLTPGQREAIVTAVEAGYFDVPRKTTLDELATGFDVSPQALSQRIRRATHEILRDVLDT